MKNLISIYFTAIFLVRKFWFSKQGLAYSVSQSVVSSVIHLVISRPSLYILPSAASCSTPFIVLHDQPASIEAPKSSNSLWPSCWLKCSKTGIIVVFLVDYMKQKLDKNFMSLLCCVQECILIVIIRGLWFRTLLQQKLNHCIMAILCYPGFEPFFTSEFGLAPVHVYIVIWIVISRGKYIFHTYDSFFTFIHIYISIIS